MMCGWPHSLLDWDVLFLLPLPWWGPVLAPVLIAALMILWGTLATQFESANPPAPPNRNAWLLNAAGIALALYVFMADTLAMAPRGLAAVCGILPERFNWLWFGLAWLMMAAPVFHEFAGMIPARGRQPALPETGQASHGRSSE
jgi:hypothetical protein